ncbi:hypothetical protein P8452_11609 [Trifolium repens]|nr:hypothetical protein P8452_11609 [Trifolium repens]
MFYMKEVYTFGHGVSTATKLLGSTPHDQLLIKTSDSFSGLLLIAIGFLLFMVSKVEDLAWDWLRQTVGDVLLALSWVFFLIFSWREKYD